MSWCGVLARLGSAIAFLIALAHANSRLLILCPYGVHALTRSGAVNLDTTGIVLAYTAQGPINSYTSFQCLLSLHTRRCHSFVGLTTCGDCHFLYATKLEVDLLRCYIYHVFALVWSHVIAAVP